MGKRKLELAIINQITQVFLTVPDNEMYSDVLQIVLNAMDSKYGVFCYIDQEGTLVCPAMTRDVWAQREIPDKDKVFPRDTWGSIWGKAITEKKTLCSNQPFRVPKGHVPVFRALDVPIIFRGAVIANLLVGNKSSDYNKDDCALLETIANQIAPILDARLKRDREEKARKQAEELFRKETHFLNERVKELNCLYGIAKIVEEEISLEAILRSIVDLIPPAWQYSDITCARIVIEGQEYQTENYKHTTFKQTALIKIKGQQIGILEVCYLENKAACEEGPFLKHERFLIDTIAERIGSIIQHKNLENERNVLYENLQNALTKVLSGFIPICSSCKKIRDDKGMWHPVEVYVRDNTDAKFSHSICPDCGEKLYPGYSNKKKSRG
ncbi:MAG: GAF domain-containing protein [Pseudomonadota bacterium]